MKIAYLGYDALFPCLEAAFRASDEILKIFTFPTDNVFEFNKEVTAFADNHAIPWSDKRITEEDIRQLHKQGCELLVCAGYIYKIPVLQIMPGINVHPALLPLGRGAWPMPVTILKGLKESGVTIHKIEASFDTGDILAQEKVYLENDETLTSLTDKLTEKAAPLLEKCLLNYEHYSKNAYKQGKGEYWAQPDEKDMTFSEKTQIELTDKIVRAFDGFGSIFKNGDKEITVVHGKCIFEEHNYPLGSLQYRNGIECYAVNGGFLQITE